MIYSNLMTDLNAAVEVIRNVIIIFLRLNDFWHPLLGKKWVFGYYH